MLLDTQVYPTPKEQRENGKSKKDVGLYAMNYGTTYVASVAMYLDFFYR